MTDVFEDFTVALERADGTIYTLSPEAFRLAARCQSTLLLTACVKRYNARMVREGINEHARLVSKRRR